MGIQLGEVGCLIAHFLLIALGISLKYSVFIRDKQTGTKKKELVRPHVVLCHCKAWIDRI